MGLDMAGVRESVGETHGASAETKCLSVSDMGLLEAPPTSKYSSLRRESEWKQGHIEGEEQGEQALGGAPNMCGGSVKRG